MYLKIFRDWSSVYASHCVLTVKKKNETALQNINLPHEVNRFQTYYEKFYNFFFY